MVGRRFGAARRASARRKLSDMPLPQRSHQLACVVQLIQNERQTLARQIQK
jgi:hypothetical protein